MGNSFLALLSLWGKCDCSRPAAVSLASEIRLLSLSLSLFKVIRRPSRSFLPIIPQNFSFVKSEIT